MPERTNMSPRQNGVWAFNPLFDDRWADLISCHPSPSVFNTRGWLTALQSSYGCDPIAFKTSSPPEPLTTALLVCRLRSGLTGSRLVSLPFSDHCEPWVKDSDQFKALCGYAESYRESEGWKYVEMRSANAILDFEGRFTCSSTHQLHRLDLRPSL